MASVTIVRDVVFDGDNPFVVPTEEELKTAMAGLKKAAPSNGRDYMEAQIEQFRELRKSKADSIQTVTITVRKPSPEDRVEIRSASRDGQGQYDAELEPMQACLRLIESWDLKDAEGKPLVVSPESIKKEMPLCLLDVTYGTLRQYLYPTQSRLSFLPPWGG